MRKRKYNLLLNIRPLQLHSIAVKVWTLAVDVPFAYLADHNAILALLLV